MDCIFCKIIDNEIESYTIYEDNIVKVFLDNSPDFNGHLLIVPKKHIVDINDMDNNTLLHIHEISKNMQKLLEERLSIKGLTMLHNSGNAQNIKHFHLHLIPRDKTTNEKEEILPLNQIYNLLTEKN